MIGLSDAIDVNESYNNDKFQFINSGSVNISVENTGIETLEVMR